MVKGFDDDDEKSIPCRLDVMSSLLELLMVRGVDGDIAMHLSSVSFFFFIRLDYLLSFPGNPSNTWPTHQVISSTVRRATILDKLNGILRPPLPPKSVIGKWHVLAFTHLHPRFGGEGAFLFHFILSEIVYEPLLGVTSSIWGNHDTKSALVCSKVTSSESTSPIQKIN